MAGIDLGTDNIAAIVSTDHSSRVYKGGAVLSENRSFHKKKAEAAGIITRGTRHRHADSAHLRRLSLRHDCFMRDMMHKISTDIVRYCIKHGVGTVVIGTSKGWKQGNDMGKENNQNFVSIPHDRLRKMILYKAGNAKGYVLEAEDYEISINTDSHNKIESKIFNVATTEVYSGSNKRASDQITATNQFDYAEEPPYGA